MVEIKTIIHDLQSVLPWKKSDPRCVWTYTDSLEWLTKELKKPKGNNSKWNALFCSFSQLSLPLCVLKLNQGPLNKLVRLIIASLTILLIFDWYHFFTEYNKYYDIEIALVLRLKKFIPNASEELDGIAAATSGIKAGVNAKNKTAILKYYEILRRYFIAALPKLSRYPPIVPILPANKASIEGQLKQLLDGTATIRDINETNKRSALILEKFVPK